MDHTETVLIPHVRSDSPGARSAPHRGGAPARHGMARRDDGPVAAPAAPEDDGRLVIGEYVVLGYD